MERLALPPRGPSQSRASSSSSPSPDSLPRSIVFRNPPPFDFDAKTFYVVTQGRRCGVYSDWNYAGGLVLNVPNVYKGYRDFNKACEAWWENRPRARISRKTVRDDAFYGPRGSAFDDPPRRW
ncbi:hypothetical protein ONZ45_g12396 [Pleurotus djamor]|nr:hypothetical protein ONZ45_g12396 [Pleurotus djamor]